MFLPVTRWVGRQRLSVAIRIGYTFVCREVPSAAWMLTVLYSYFELI
jgi:hypothetical protein